MHGPIVSVSSSEQDPWSSDENHILLSYGKTLVFCFLL